MLGAFLIFCSVVVTSSTTSSSSISSSDSSSSSWWFSSTCNLEIPAPPSTAVSVAQSLSSTTSSTDSSTASSVDCSASAAAIHDNLFSTILSVRSSSNCPSFSFCSIGFSDFLMSFSSILNSSLTSCLPSSCSWHTCTRSTLLPISFEKQLR